MTNKKTYARPATYNCFVYRVAHELQMNESHPAILAVKKFRDETLAMNPFGIKLIETYYAQTSSLVEAFEKRADQRKRAAQLWSKLEEAAAHIDAQRESAAIASLQDFFAAAKV